MRASATASSTGLPAASERVNWRKNACAATTNMLTCMPTTKGTPARTSAAALPDQIDSVSASAVWFSAAALVNAETVAD